MDSIFIKKERSNVFHSDLEQESCHASSLIRLDNGDFVCVWFQGSAEGAQDVKIWGTVRKNGIWNTPEVIAEHKNIPCWNPVLFKVAPDRIMLFYKCGKEIATWKTMYKISDDSGETWSGSGELVEGDSGGRGPVRNQPIRLKSGRILAPGSLENGPWRSFADISDDDGITWRKSEEVQIDLPKLQKLNENYKEIPVSEQSYRGRGIIQPALWEGKGSVHMLMRSSEGWIYHSKSEDEGETWSDPEPTDIPNNNSGIDAVCTSDGTVYLVCNPVGESWGKRTPISLYCSEDDGIHWEHIMILDEGEGEFSYPCIIYDNGSVFITYTWKRKNIAFWEIEFKCEDNQKHL